MFRRATPLLWIAGIAGALWLIFPFGFPNYDTVYPLVWGNELAHGLSPDYGAPQPPTPHPLADLWGTIVSPLGAAGASDATTVLAYLALGAIAYLVYRLGALWFDAPIGVVAALIVLTRPPFLIDGLRAYVDLPYIALALAALLIEARRPRAGWPVLALLAAAGLLRPEAWLFSAAYLAYMALERDTQKGRLALRLRPQLDQRALAGLAALAAVAPVAWAAFDLITTGDPLYSLTVTHDTVQTLGRQTGPVHLILDGPHQLGEVMQRPGLIGAAAGIALALAFMRRRALIGIAATVLAAAAFVIVACAGLAIISRYMLLGSALLCVFCAAALLGWRLMPQTHPWRRRWQLIAAALALIFVVQAPQQYDYLSTVRSDIDSQSAIEADLHHLAESGAFEQGCRPVSVPNHRAIPRLAAWLDLRPSAIVSVTEQRRPSHGYFLEPANAEVAGHYFKAKVPPHFRLAARNASFLLYARCG
jgi:hypothetical protein